MSFTYEYLTNYCAKALEICGVSDEAAMTTAKTLVSADMRGIHSHGLVRLIGYVNCLQSGGVNAKAQPFVTLQSDSFAMVDADRGLGIPASVFATKLAIEKAHRSGICMVNVRNSHHHGACGYYATMMSDAGLMSMAMSTGNILMAAPGSISRIIGNNPYAFAVPAHKHRFICFDAAMSTVAAGKISMAADEGREIPHGWLKDLLGNDTTDPNQYALGGALTPAGAHKGFSMSVMVECFAGLLSGAASLEDISAWNNDPNKSGDVGHMFLAVDPKILCPNQDIAARADTLIDKLTSAAPAPGYDRVLFPGQLEMEREAKAIAEGIELPEATLHALRQAGEKTAFEFKD